MTRPPPRSTLFPYTTLFRSVLTGDVRGQSPDTSFTDAARVGVCDGDGGGLWLGREQAAQDVREDAAVPEVLPLARRVEPHRSEEHTSELQSLAYLVCRLLLE